MSGEGTRASGEGARASGGFRRVAVLGVGLLGGSLARAVRARGLAETVVGSGRRLDALAEAVRRGWLDATAPVEEAVEGADLVVLATPVGAMAGLLRRAAPHLTPGCVVTDVGSVKECLVDTLPGLLPPGAAYVGAHPMAGSHLRGVEHAREALFDGSVCILTPTPESDRDAVARVADFWRALGCRVVERSPAAHDREVAWVSHVPHVLAFAFARGLGSAPATARELAGPGFRDFTRIAHSDAELWSDILTANGKALVGPLQQVAESLAALGRALEAEDADAVEQLVVRARRALADGTETARSGGANPEIRAPERSPHRSESTES